MEALAILTRLNGKLVTLIAILLVVGGVFAVLAERRPTSGPTFVVHSGLPADRHVSDFGLLAVLGLSGRVRFGRLGVPVRFGRLFPWRFSLIEFFNFLPRIWGQAAENLVLVSIPAFVFMGIMMERSGVAADLLYTVQVVEARSRCARAGGHHHGHHPRRDDRHHRGFRDHDDGPALPTMMRQGYSHALACGTIAASGHARHPDPAEHHADHYGRPDVGVGRQRVHGRLGAGLALVALYVSSWSLARGEAVARATAARSPARAQGREHRPLISRHSSRRSF